MKRWFWNTIKLLIAGGLIYLLFRSGQLKVESLGAAIRRWPLFGAAAGLIVLSLSIIVQRWRMILSSQGISLSYRPALKLTLIGLFFGTVLPGTIGGDFAKAYYLAKGEKQKAVLVSSVFLDRLLGLYTMIGVAATAVAISFVSGRVFGSSIHWKNPVVISLGAFIWTLFLGATLVGVLFSSQKIKSSAFIAKLIRRLPFSKTITEAYEVLHRFGRNRAVLARILSLSVLSDLVTYAGLWLLAMLLNVRGIRLLDYFYLLPSGLLSMAIPLAPGGLGLGELGFSRLFAIFGAGQGAAVAMLYHILYYLMALVGGGIAYIFSDLKKSKLRMVDLSLP